jgi:hypothetical protein
MEVMGDLGRRGQQGFLLNVNSLFHDWLIDIFNCSFVFANSSFPSLSFRLAFP